MPATATPLPYISTLYVYVYALRSTSRAPSPSHLRLSTDGMMKRDGVYLIRTSQSLPPSLQISLSFPPPPAPPTHDHPSSESSNSTVRTIHSQLTIQSRLTDRPTNGRTYGEKISAQRQFNARSQIQALPLHGGPDHCCDVSCDGNDDGDRDSFSGDHLTLPSFLRLISPRLASPNQNRLGSLHSSESNLESQKSNRVSELSELSKGSKGSKLSLCSPIEILQVSERSKRSILSKLRTLTLLVHRNSRNSKLSTFSKLSNPPELSERLEPTLNSGHPSSESLILTHPRQIQFSPILSFPYYSNPFRSDPIQSNRVSNRIESKSNSVERGEFLFCEELMIWR